MSKPFSGRAMNSGRAALESYFEANRLCRYLDSACGCSTKSLHTLVEISDIAKALHVTLVCSFGNFDATVRRFSTLAQ